MLRTVYFPSHLEMEWHDPYGRAEIQAFAKRHTLVRYDQRGGGLSVQDLPRFSLEQTADDMRAVLDAVGVDKAAIHGISNGALNAVQFAVSYPDRVSRLVLEGGYVDGRVRRHEGKNDAASEPILSMLRECWDQQNKAFVKGYVTMYFPDAPKESIENFAMILQSASSAENAVLVRDANNQRSIAPLLGRVGVPTLVIHGRGDNVHPLSEARKMAGGIAGVELLVLETANSIIFSADPCWDEFAAPSRNFLPKADSAPVRFFRTTSRRSGGGARRSGRTLHSMLVLGVTRA